MWTVGTPGLGDVRPLLVLLAALVAGCTRTEASPRPMTLEAIRPADGRGIYLNEELVLTFSSELDPISITRESLRIRDPRGIPARGTWTVAGRQARFRPDPVLSRDLDDGGYRPGTSYTLEAVGFPRLDGLRSLDGAPLARTLRWEFSTVEVGERQGGFVFDDSSPGIGWPATVDLDPRRPVQPWGPIVLKCAEPLDPSSLVDSEFWLEYEERPIPLGPDGTEPQPGGAVRREFPLRGRFRANGPASRLAPYGVAAVLEFWPLQPLEPREYVFHVGREGKGGGRAGASLCDFHGNPVWPEVYFRTPIRIQVARTQREGDRRLHLSFLDPTPLSSLEVPWADGLAHWSGSGRLEVRYPAAAGSGEHGELELTGSEPRLDVQATRLRVPAGSLATLAPGGGLRILRSQGRLTISGRLERRAGGERVNWPEDVGELFRDRTLTRWLERAADEGWDWTVLVAGGDLVIDGSIEVDTPLLLVAGGWIRIDDHGRVRQRPEQLWLLRDGGGLHLDPTASVPPLVMDAPSVNPLRQPQVWAVVTAPLPALVRPYRWVDVDADGRDGGGGGWSVSFLPPGGPLDRGRVVGHPQLLETLGQLRVLVELRVDPGGEWDPPSLDYVDLGWELGR